jgi:tetratricopeptide (TPR) repeat protein
LHYTAALQRCGRLPEALLALTEFVDQWPEHLESRHHLGLLFLQTDSPDSAVAQFRFVLDRDPSRLATWMALARALLAANDPGGAEAALGEAMRLAPGNPEPMVLRGTVLQSQGRYAEARAALEGVLEANAGHGPALVGLAEIDLATGQPEQGLERLDGLSGDVSRAPRVMITCAGLLAATGQTEEAVRRIEDWLEKSDLPPRAKTRLLVQKGRLLDALGDHDAAWEAWALSRQLAPPRLPASHFTQAVERLVGAYDTEFFKGLHATGVTDGSQIPVLIVGAPGSGKSILEQILSCHPSVRGAGELRLLGGLSNEAARRRGTAARPYPDCVTALLEEDIEDLRRDYRQSLQRLGGESGWVTDTQPTNFLHVGLAAMMEPRLKVVFCRRDPLDAAWACLSRQFADPGLDFVATPEGFQVFLAGMSRLMRHWETVIPLEILEVRYEDLVTSTRITTERAVGYLGLEWNESLMRFAEPGQADLGCAPVVTGSLNDAEIGRGRPYADRIGVGVRLGHGAGSGG